MGLSLPGGILPLEGYLSTMSLGFDSERVVQVFARFTIQGQPVGSKNRVQIMRRGPHLGIGHTRPVRAWMEVAVTQLRCQWGPRPPLEHQLDTGQELNAVIWTYLAKGQHLDADNAYQGPQDALVKAGVLRSDHCIGAHDGSFRSRDPERPRVEIMLTEMLR